MREKAVVFTFAAFLAIVSFINLITPDKKFSESENRVLASKPTLSWKNIISGKFSKEFESYIKDQFPARDKWVSLKSSTEMALGKKDNGRVYFGKEDYLIEKHSPDSIDLNRIKDNINILNSFIKNASKQIPKEKINIIMAPTVEIIDQEKLPDYANVFNQRAIINKMKKEFTSGNVIDVTEALKNSKDEYIYYRTDHHWTTKGAYIAYKEWCRAVKEEAAPEEKFQIIKVTESFLGSTYSKANIYTQKPDEIHIYRPLFPIDYEVDYNMGQRKTTSLYEMKHIDTKDKYSVFLNGNNALVTIKTSNKNGRNLLIIKDSYANSFIPFIANHFEKIHVADLRYNNMSMEKYIKDNSINEIIILYNVIGFAKDRNIINLRR
ncbi:DHHW family protein [Clostridium polynesiense]|uniref:DHHW family protein n=1 Tax=Clostridium polynesiense TaxID=1325933 RepID=UPI000590AD3A|nr:DHHW family protein [Clostridium polynesiense]